MHIEGWCERDGFYEAVWRRGLNIFGWGKSRFVSDGVAEYKTQRETITNNLTSLNIFADLYTLYPCPKYREFLPEAYQLNK